MIFTSYALRNVMMQMITNNNSNWEYCAFIPRKNSPKWDLHDGLLILVLDGVHFSVLGVTKLQETQQFVFVHLCNEGRKLPIMYRGDLSDIGASNVTPRHRIRNTDRTKNGFYVLWFSQMLLSFGTDIENIGRNFIRNYFRDFDEDIRIELAHWLGNFQHA